ncbi:helix-turn-helix domain-containing protein [Streptomyces javensis]|uniref:Helix-turn-helix domain-containing protein n=1 Tax=Streptomyces javensis TaxID=114698 RepID=A0ABN1XBX3_9ACTN
MTESPVRGRTARRRDDPLSTWMPAVTDTLRAINAEQDLPHVLTLIARHACELLDLKQCAVYVLRSDATFRLEGSHGLTPDYVAWANLEPMRLSESTASSGPPTARAALTMNPVCVRNIFDEPGLDRWHTMMTREGFHSVLAAPLRAADQTAMGTITGYTTEDRLFEAEQIRLMTLLSDHAAVAIAAARRRDSERAAIAELSSANEELLAHQRRMARLHVVQQELTRLLLQDVGLAGIAEFLAGELDAAIRIDTDDGTELATAPMDSPLHTWLETVAHDEAGTARVMEAGGSGRTRGSGRTDPVAVCLAPTTGAGLSRTRLWAARTSRDRFDEDERWAMQGCALLIALERSRLERQSEAEARLTKDLLADLLSPAAMVHSESVMARATALGYHPHGPHTLALFVPVPDDSVPAPAAAIPEITTTLLGLTRGMRPRPVVGSIGDSVVVLLPGDYTHCAEGSPPTALGSLAGHAREATGGAVRCVVGPPVPSLAEIQPSLAVASRAGSLLTTASPEIVSMPDLGVYALLLESGSGEALTRFAEATLAPIADSDLKRGGWLLPTLHTWLRAGMSTRGTAERLFVHPNTVGYRLKRVAAATGLDLSSPADLMSLQLALMVFEVRGDPRLRGGQRQAG